MSGIFIDPSTPTLSTQTVGTTATVVSNTFTPPVGSYLLVLWSGNTQSGTGPSAPTITDSLGVHLTYTGPIWQSKADAPGNDGQVAIWRAAVGASGGTPMTVTVTSGTASGNRQSAIQPIVLTGQDPAAPIGAFGKSGGNASSVSQNYTCQATGGAGFLVTCDFDTTGAQTEGGGCTVIGSADVGTAFTYGFARRTVFDDTNGSNNTLNVSLPANSANLTWAWIEVLPLADVIDPYSPAVKFPPWLLFLLAEQYQKQYTLPDPLSPDFVAPTLIQYTETDWNTTGTSKATPSISWNAGDLIVIHGGTEAQSRTIVPTVTGGVLTFLADTPITDVSTCWSNTWHVIAPSSGSSIVTVTLTGAAGQYGAAVWVYRGSDGVGARVSNANATKTVTLNRTGNHSATTESLFDFDAGSVAGHTWTPAGQTEDEATANTGYTVYIADWPDQGAPRPIIYGISGTASTGMHSKIAYEILGTLAIAAATQTITPVGIEPSENFGNPSVTTTVSITPAAITSSEQFGNVTATTTVSITPSGISSTEQFGNVAIAQYVSAYGISSTEKFGNPSVTTTVSALAFGISSTEQFGNPTITQAQIVSAYGITSTEQFGNVSVTTNNSVLPSAITPSEQFGNPTVTSTVTVSPFGISSSEQFGSITTTVVTAINPYGISTTEKFGNPTVTTTATVSPVGISSNEQFGTASAGLSVTPKSITSSEQFGNVSVVQTVAPYGISTNENFGNVSITSSATVAPRSITTNEQFGNVTITELTAIAPIGISSSEQFGNATVTPGAVTVSAYGIASSETFGNIAVQLAQNIIAQSITTNEKFGNPTTTPGSVTIVPVGITGSEQFGNLSIAQAVAPVGISSTESLGNPTLTVVTAINPTGIGSSEKFGNATITTTYTISAYGIGSSERSGNSTVATASTIQVTSITSSERFGNPTITTGPVTVSAVSISSGERFGSTTVSLGFLQFNIFPVGIASGERFGGTTHTGPSVTPNVLATLGPDVVTWRQPDTINVTISDDDVIWRQPDTVNVIVSNDADVTVVT